MLGSAAGPGGPTQRGLWPLAPAPSVTSFTSDSLSKYAGVYSLFPSGPGLGGAFYSHASTIGRFSGHIQQSTGNTFHATHKVSDSLFSSTGYTFGAPTPPPGSPYSPIPVTTQLELLTKGYNSSIIIQPPDYPPSPKKLQITTTTNSDKQPRCCDEKCCKPQKACNCQLDSPSSVKNGNKYGNENNNLTTGCSRTNPIEWCNVNVKKEPGVTPCQVAEITTSMSPSVIKMEMTSPTSQKNDTNLNLSTNNSNNIPVGIAVARQRVQEIVASPSLNPTGLLTTVSTAAHIKDVPRISEIDSTVSSIGGSMAASSVNAGGGVPAAGGALLSCTDDRPPGLAAWSMGGTHNQTLTAPTLWQYPAPVSMEPMVPLPVPMPPVGFQLVREPTTGGLLLLPTAGIEPVQQAVVWPNYNQPSSVLLPSLPPPPLQLLNSAASSDYLTSSTTLHQHTQTHSTRLVAVTTDTKRKILPPTTTLIKLEADSLDHQTKTLQTVCSTMASTNTFNAEQPLVTTHLIYQHPSTNLILSQNASSTTAVSTAGSVQEMVCRSQGTSPVACLTPPPETMQIDEQQQQQQHTVQDASNQTEIPNDDDNNTINKDVIEEKINVNIDNSSSKTEVPDEIIREELNKCDDDDEMDNNKKDKPDISGLELLSNSIVEFEKNNNNIKEENNVQDEQENNSLGGLDLLCALAEQRIREENNSEIKMKKDKSLRRKEKRKSKKHSDEPKRKKLKNYTGECNCQTENYRTYKTPESEEEVRKFIASKTQQMCCKGDWPCMNALELDMRMKLADIQRQYREKQKELSKLKPKKHHSQQCTKKRSRKKSINIEQTVTPPPLLDKMDVPIKPNHQITSDLLLKPPTLCAMPKIPETIHNNNNKRPPTPSDIDSSPEKSSSSCSSISSLSSSSSSSQKRKVGRPKKLLTHSGLNVQATETIVAKKPKSLVSFLLAAKEKIQMQNLYSNSPPRYVEDIKPPKKTKNNNHIIVDDDEDMKSSKIRPKLKAEPTVKEYTDDDVWENVDDDDLEEEDHIETDIEEEEEVEEPETVEEPSPPETDKEEVTDEVKVVEDETKIDDEEKIEIVEEVKPEDTRCTLTREHLEIDKLRVLTATGGLFYAGHLNAVQPPDVYSITLDGERGNRPHIMSREEILRDAILEVSPKSTSDLPVGTRLCAYWSQQYRCLYPGSVAEPGTPDPALDERFVAVEFDDGDSGRIALDDIRFLPPDYPIIEYDPNPLLSLSKRRRRTSTTSTNHSIEERRQSLNAQQVQIPPIIIESKEIKDDTEKENTNINKKMDMEKYKEKKRLKKKKREKLKQKLIHENNTRKKKKKHKCNDENCKHKKHHKKHRKHKKHHNREIDEDVVKESIIVPEIVQQQEPEEVDDFEQIDVIPNPDDEVTMDDILESRSNKKSKKIRDRQESCESRSKMSAFLPARQLWSWAGKGYKRQRAKGRSKKSFYKSIQRGKETITVGDSAVFLSTGRPDRPYIGRIEAMWELCSTMVVKVKWFYHPEETVGCPLNLQYPGALFESPHVDENDVQTISHKCEVLPLKEYTERLGDDPQRYETIYDNNDIYYLAGYYDPTTTTLKIEPNIPFSKTD